MVTNSQPYINPYAKPITTPTQSVRARKFWDSPSSVLIIEKQKSEVELDFMNEEKPNVPFFLQFFFVQNDPRLNLSSETYVQMIMSAGLRIKIKQPLLNKRVNKWSDKIQLEKKLEDGLYSLVDTGNMMFEKAPGLADLVEIDMATIHSAERKKTGEIIQYRQEVNQVPIPLDPKDIIHFKLTNVRKEVWGRGLFNALFSEKSIGGVDMESPIVSQWKMEDTMVKIFDNYASPMMMINFKDAGEDWIKKQEAAFKKIEQGAKIITDKEFDAKVFEVAPNAKFEGWVNHREENIIEPGSQFPLGFFNNGFTAQAAAEITDSVLGRKIKRIQKRVANQIKKDIILPYIKALGVSVEEEDVKVAFEIESKAEIEETDLLVMFEKGVISRSEFRKHLAKKTTVQLDEDDMADTPPITSVTPTNDLRTTQPSPAAQGVDPQQQQVQLTQMQQAMNEMKEELLSKIPKPRGRPKKKEIIATLPDVRSLEDLEARIRFNHPDMPEDEIMQLVRLMEPIFFTDQE